MRAVENFDTPYMRQLIGELRTLQKRVEHIDIAGSALAQQQLGTIDYKVEDLRGDIAALTGIALIKLEKQLELKASKEILDGVITERKTDKSQVRAALIAAVLSVMASIIVGIVVWAVTAR